MAGKEATWDTPTNLANERGLGSASVDAAVQGDMEEDAVDWLAIARTAYEDSDQFFTQAAATRMRDDIRAFNSQHPLGSKYTSTEYRHRSKYFRPKTRAAMRKSESSCAQAFFGTAEVLNVEAQDQGDPLQLASADITKALVEYRLDKTIPWFMTLLGAFQDASVSGYCVSKQWWEYAEETWTESVEGADPVTGQPVMVDMPKRTVKVDRPHIDLIAPENIRIDKAANWIDPANSSPFLINLIPTYVGDVKQRMRTKDPKTGQPEWTHYDDGEIKTAVDQDYDSVRQAREDGRTDSRENSTSISDFTPVWVHENFIRRDGVDWHFYTLGTMKLLSEPRPVEEVYPQCAKTKKRPIRIGMVVLETHKIYPSSKVTLGIQLQREANDLANRRMDNVTLAMDGVNKVKKGTVEDLQTIRDRVPNQIVQVNDMDGWTVERAPDVTASSYQEQDRLNLDFDEVIGNFSSGSVQSNRKLNETVGGMQLMAGDANAVGEYDLRVFSETWVEPVLRDVVILEQMFETDPVILALAGTKADIYQQFGISTIDDELLGQELTTRVNVGFGATDPNQRINRFLTGVRAVGEVVGEEGRGLANVEEIAAEVFGILGYKDGKRFFRFEPTVREQQLQKGIAELQAKIQQLESDNAGKTMDAQVKMQIGIMNLKLKALESQQESRIRERELQQEMALAQQKAAFDQRLTVLQHGFDNQMAQRDMANREAAVDRESQMKVEGASRDHALELLRMAMKSGESQGNQEQMRRLERALEGRDDDDGGENGSTSPVETLHKVIQQIAQFGAQIAEKLDQNIQALGEKVDQSTQAIERTQAQQGSDLRDLIAAMSRDKSIEWTDARGQKRSATTRMQ
jgi:hypothetical protein